jgi:hypothetical protein
MLLRAAVNPFRVVLKSGLACASALLSVSAFADFDTVPAQVQRSQPRNPPLSHRRVRRYFAACLIVLLDCCKEKMIVHPSLGRRPGTTTRGKRAYRNWCRHPLEPGDSGCRQHARASCRIISGFLTDSAIAKVLGVHCTALVPPRAAVTRVPSSALDQRADRSELSATSPHHVQCRDEARVCPLGPVVTWPLGR